MSAGDLLNEDNEKKFIVMSEFNKLKDVGDVIIRSGFEGKRVVVSDVSIISDEFEEPENIIRYNGQDSINVIIIKKPKTDIIKAVKSIKKDIKDFKEVLPGNIQTNQIVDYSTEVKNLLNLALSNAWMGIFLVILVLMLLLNRRLAFWIAMGIPTSIFIAFMLFPFFGININFISLMAIIIVFTILSFLPFEVLDSFKPYFFTTYLDEWKMFFTDPIDFTNILNSAGIIVFHIILLYLITLYLFARKDILT